jgi:hypothetical protein
VDDEYSFYSEDSYSLIVKGPDPAKIRKRPRAVPQLELEGLPGYESSEEDEEQADQVDQAESDQ